MPVTKVSVGVVMQLLQNVAYALPADEQVIVYTDGTTPTLQQSTDAAFTANTAVTLTAGQSSLAGAFVRCTSGNINVMFVRA